MTTKPLAACLVKRDDIVQVDGEGRVVDSVSSHFESSSTPYVVLKFKDDGDPLRIHAGARLDIERPGSP